MTSVFRDAYRFWRVLHKYPKLKRSSSDVHDLHNEVELILSPDSVHSYCDCDFKSSQTRNNIYFLGRPYLPESLDDKESDNATDEKQCCSNGHATSNGDPFRNRASTDGNLSRRPRKWKYPSFSGTLVSPPARIERRMSISMRGTNTNASYWNWGNFDYPCWRIIRGFNKTFRVHCTDKTPQMGHEWSFILKIDKLFFL